jgi:hypothetical protein
MLDMFAYSFRRPEFNTVSKLEALNCCNDIMHASESGWLYRLPKVVFV